MRVALLALAAALAACSESPGADDASLQEHGPGAGVATATAAAAVTRDDLAVYRRGMTAEIDTMRRMIAAPGFTRPPRGAPGAGQSALVAALDSAGARSALVDVERFRDTMRRVNAVLRALSSTTVLSAVLDTASLPERDRPAARAQLRQFEQRAFRLVNPASVEVVRAEAESLDSLRRQFAGYGMRVGRP